jgi:hypothetical protein
VDDPALLDPGLGLCDPACYFTFLSPRVLSEIGKEGPFVESWDMVDACLAPETTRVIKSLHEDPSPLCAALQHLPQTLTHGDWATRNLGIDPQRSSSVLAIDWQVAYCGVPTQDLFRYLVAEKVQVEPSVVGDFPESIHYYRTCYEQHADTVLDDEGWGAQVELGLLGVFLAFGGLWTNNMVRRDRLAELPWIEQKIQAGAARL